MAPKVRNVASGVGSKRNRKGETSGSSSTGEPFQKFGKKVVERYGHKWFECQKRQNTLEMSTSMSVFLPAKHLIDMTRDRVVLVYMLMKGMPINVGAILRQNMMKFRKNMRWRFCYGEMITRLLRAEGIEKEELDVTVARHHALVGKIVDVTQTKALDTSYEPILSAQEWHACDDSVMLVCSEWRSYILGLGAARSWMRRWRPWQIATR
ncbi:hypothetical protein H5410_051427 [Solanum commersonii]|uniref:Putative plant transposon protein domain-containing protein n=1 Tax=Solanum commersonii TaxID=4109 RepID=A0A9J5X0X9_SOLCO|nr:hypothetical protein H5410_051427 [Solanum commersonii]